MSRWSETFFLLSTNRQPTKMQDFNRNKQNSH